jgi:6-pyruvoyltetrahydropterin/6-carboxytetrahydropterin synthase
MKRIRITKEFGFEMAHALMHHDGPCRHIHGHSYKLSVTIAGSVLSDRSSPKQGMVMDFGDLKQIVNEYIVKRLDHALVLNEVDAGFELNVQHVYFGRLVTVPYQPTCENLLLDFAQILQEKLPQKVLLHHLLLRETPSSYSEWYAEDNEIPGSI